MEPFILYNFKNKNIYCKMCKKYLYLEKTFIELINNAFENVPRSRSLGLDPKQIEVSMNETEITIKNYGNVIPIIIHPTYGKYIPYVIFGELDTIHANGIYRYQNGVGARVANMASKFFNVEIQDNDKYYSKTWYNNMEKSEEAIIKTTNNKESYVKITYISDFKRYGINKYPKYMIQMFAAYCLSESNKLKIPILFNGEYLTT